MRPCVAFLHADGHGGKAASVEETMIPRLDAKEGVSVRLSEKNHVTIKSTLSFRFKVERMDMAFASEFVQSTYAYAPGFDWP